MFASDVTPTYVSPERLSPGLVVVVPPRSFRVSEVVPCLRVSTPTVGRPLRDMSFRYPRDLTNLLWDLCHPPLCVSGSVRNRRPYGPGSLVRLAARSRSETGRTSPVSRRGPSVRPTTHGPPSYAGSPDFKRLYRSTGAEGADRSEAGAGRDAGRPRVPPASSPVTGGRPTYSQDRSPPATRVHAHCEPERPTRRTRRRETTPEVAAITRLKSPDNP